jgi:hypothetical protein
MRSVRKCCGFNATGSLRFVIQLGFALAIAMLNGCRATQRQRSAAVTPSLVSSQSPLNVLTIRYSVQRAADQARYPLPVIESYTVDAARTLHYTAYFMNMPIHLNHNDSIDWQTGDDQSELLDASRRVADEMLPLDDAQKAPEGSYVIEVRINDRESCRYVSDSNSKVWQAIDAPFQKMIRNFEQATSRPRDPYKLASGR